MPSRNNVVNEKQLKYIEFLNRENAFRHHYYDEEMLQYEYLKKGDLAAIEEGSKMFSSPIVGKLAGDKLRNWKYMFVASTTLATRFAIEGGMESENAYNASDLYIQKMDMRQEISEIKTLHKDMLTYFTKHVASLTKKTVYSKHIVLCMDYIYYHLNEPIHIQDLADQIKLNPSYLSVLFKKEVGIPLSEYILKKRIEASENMLKYSDYTYSEISSILAFSSQSHFIKQFKRFTGLTPKEYKNKYFRVSFSAGNPTDKSKGSGRHEAPVLHNIGP